MMLDQLVLFFQEWWPLMALIIAVLLVMAADLFPKLGQFMREVKQRYPNAVDVLFSRQQYVIDCYERLPLRIRAGFALIGGKQAWAWLVKAGYSYLRRN
ncbi:hypothetical protein [Brevibacillus choshinensis]|uniref:Uncharacterized protein n=1 Tax=Brevibacillus choshinensis TaxID=54911 RepID=A0ABX7FTL6_BRECH|nr:hypothetical protein [Brevibacillus choshinensis]QRG68617.1 hypothetical protein JNE38_05550 [Brevibacillus choshinensis]